MKNAKITSIFIIVSVSIMLFTACSSTNEKPPVTPQTAVNDTEKGISTAMKTIYVDTLKGLVKVKTITQTQSDKVMEEVTKNVSKAKGSINRLDKLVKNKVINQNQADKINQEIEKGKKDIEDK